MKKIVGIATDIFIVLLFILSAIFFMKSFVQKEPTYTLVHVQSGSMRSSGIEIGDVRLIKRFREYKVGDIIAFHKDGSIYFHKIVDENENGFVTKGTSNSNIDSGIVRHENIIGKQITEMNMNWLVSPQFRIGLILTMYLIITSYLVYYLYNLLFKEGKLFTGDRFYLITILLIGFTSFLLPVFASPNNYIGVESKSEYEAFIDTGYFTIVNDEVVGYDNSSGETVVTFPTYNSNGDPITTVIDKVIRFNNNVEVVIVPPSITSLGKLNFQHCPNLKELIVLAENPICNFSNQGNPLVGIDIYVPDSVVHIYKTTHPWSIYASRIYPLSSRPN